LPAFPRTTFAKVGAKAASDIPELRTAFQEGPDVTAEFRALQQRNVAEKGMVGILPRHTILASCAAGYETVQAFFDAIQRQFTIAGLFRQQHRQSLSDRNVK
jgi:hypothetical protein